MQRLRSLTVASTCTFSYVALRAPYVTIFQVNKSVFGSEPCTLSLFFSYSYWFHSRPYSGWWTSLRCFVCFFFGWRGTRLTIRIFWIRPNHRHPVCLADILYKHCLSFDMRQCICNHDNTLICGNCVIKQLTIHAFLRYRACFQDPRIIRAVLRLCHNTLMVLRSRSRTVGFTYVMLVFRCTVSWFHEPKYSRSVCSICKHHFILIAELIL